jgi:signal transduction histidine kinase
MAGDVRDAVEHMQRVLNGLLLLARSQAGLTAREPADLAAITAAALDAVEEQAATAGVAVRSVLRPAPVTGEPVLLERMIGNLVDNALRYNHAGGHLIVETYSAGGRAVLRIGNTGREIVPEEAQRLLEPFVRGQGSRVRTDGLGLGLSIVRAVTLTHQGRIEVTARTGGGLDISVGLPQKLPSGTSPRNQHKHERGSAGGESRTAEPTQAKLQRLFKAAGRRLSLSFNLQASHMP